MTSSRLLTALTGLADRLVALSSHDAELRRELREFAEAVLDATESAEQRDEVREPAAQTAAERAAERAAEPAVEAAAAHNGDRDGRSPAAPPAPVPLEKLPELTLGQPRPPAESPPRSISEPDERTEPDDASLDENLSIIEARCRLKAEGTRWAAARHRRMLAGADFSTEIAPRDRDIIARAKELPNCFLWMCHPTGPSPSNMSHYEDVAGCFEAVADVLAVLKQFQEEPQGQQSEFEQSLDLLAEAQSALRMAIDRIHGPTDSDQLQVFQWLKRTALENQIYIQRHMRVGDPADPAGWADLAARIEEIDSRLQDRRAQLKKRRKMLGKIRHKLSLIEDDPDGSLEHWRILIATADELMEEGMPPSNRELRELLIPHIDDIPESLELPKNFELALREIDRYLASYAPPERRETVRQSPEVEQAAELLQGKSVVLIGGDRRLPAYHALIDTFKLHDLHWIETRDHQSIDVFEPYVARPNVAVVLLAIRWSSHAFGEVQQFCDRHNKPLVRLPGGYNPNQVAAQIMSQCSDRLKQAN